MAGTKKTRPPRATTPGGLGAPGRLTATYLCRGAGAAAAAAAAAPRPGKLSRRRRPVAAAASTPHHHRLPRRVADVLPHEHRPYPVRHPGRATARRRRTKVVLGTTWRATHRRPGLHPRGAGCGGHQQRPVERPVARDAHHCGVARHPSLQQPRHRRRQHPVVGERQRAERRGALPLQQGAEGRGAVASDVVLRDVEGGEGRAGAERRRERPGAWR